MERSEIRDNTIRSRESRIALRSIRATGSPRGLAMFPEEESEKKTKAVALGKPAAGQCLCGKVAFEIDVPARWAWHDHSPSSRRAHGAAYATYVGSWRKRFRITKGKTSLARYEDGATKTVRSFCSNCGTPVVYERPR